MPTFALKTLRTPADPTAALRVDGRYHPFTGLGAPWKGVTCRSLLADWDRNLPAPAQLADRLRGEDPIRAEIERVGVLAVSVHDDT